MTHPLPHRVELSYSLTKEPRSSELVHHPLFQLLDAVERRGSISAAARSLGLSYRHVWGELKRWEEDFGRLLIVWEKGQKARLTGFGAKLLWAERQAQSRLAPQIAALRADLETAFGLAFDDAAHVLSGTASHDEALALFRGFAQTRGLYLELRFGGSQVALGAMAEGRSEIAGFHFPSSGQLTEGIRSEILRALRESASGLLATALPFATRQVGLVVEHGNPLRLRGLEDVVGGQYRFVNRSPGAATRLVLDASMAELGIRREQLRGYGYEEPSHEAVAEAVRSGRADVGLALESVASSRGLGFVPLYLEDYWVAVHSDGLNAPGLTLLQDLLASDAWRATMDALVGYRAASAAAPMRLADLLASA